MVILIAAVCECIWLCNKRILFYIYRQGDKGARYDCITKEMQYIIYNHLQGYFSIYNKNSISDQSLS